MPGPNVHLVEDLDDLTEWCARLREEPALALDVESNGLFAYEPGLCVVQLATRTDVLVVDTLKIRPTPLAELFRQGGPRMVVHDLGFDARMLAKAGVPLVRVADTALAAAFLGRASTGLASVLLAELGTTHDKSLQHHDWSRRPLDEAALRYLAGDVWHLLPLWDRLSVEVETRGVLAELEEETRHRLSEARAPSDEPKRPFLRIKGKERLGAEDLPLLRALADARESLARELDVPVFKLLANDALLEIARKRPRSIAELERIPGAHRGRARALSRGLLELVAATHPPLTDEERAALSPTRPPAEIVKARKRREAALLAWRQAEARAREVNVQVVLPGHVLRRLADRSASSHEDLERTPGFGGFRVARYGDAVLALLSDDQPRAPGDEG